MIVVGYCFAERICRAATAEGYTSKVLSGGLPEHLQKPRMHRQHRTSCIRKSGGKLAKERFRECFCDPRHPKRETQGKQFISP